MLYSPNSNWFITSTNPSSKSKAQSGVGSGEKSVGGRGTNRSTVSRISSANKPANSGMKTLGFQVNASGTKLSTRARLIPKKLSVVSSIDVNLKMARP